MCKSGAIALDDSVMPAGDAFGFCFGRFGQKCGKIHLNVV
jgi:hypothetical protein